jgi:hypothetical protein
MSILNITGTATNQAGVATSFTGTISVVDAPVVNSVVVNPQSAPAGTMRTITINATDPQGQPLTFTCKVNGTNATATAQPNVFTFVA